MRQPGKYETLRYQLANMRQILLTWGLNHKSQILPLTSSKKSLNAQPQVEHLETFLRKLKAKSVI